MADKPATDEGGSPEQDNQASETVLAGPPGQSFVADTNNPGAESKTVTAARRVTTQEALSDQGLYRIQEHETRIRHHSGPLPDPETLRELGEIYPQAPKLIFEEFRAQSAHRREMEHLVIEGNLKATHRGQIIGGLIGGAGVVGSLIVAGLGYGWAGFGIAATSLVSLVSVFIHGRHAQEKERLQKEKIRRQIAKDEPVERFEGEETPGQAVKEPPPRSRSSGAPGGPGTTAY